MSQITTSESDSELVRNTREILNAEELEYIQIQFSSVSLILRNCEDVNASLIRMIEIRNGITFSHIGIDDNNSFTITFER